jgi:hypothetical protein
MAVAVQISINQYKTLLQLIEEMKDMGANGPAERPKHNFMLFSQAAS